MLASLCRYCRCDMSVRVRARWASLNQRLRAAQGRKGLTDSRLRLSLMKKTPVITPGFLFYPDYPAAYRTYSQAT